MDIWKTLLKGEILLTAHVLFGLFLADILLRLRLPERLLRRFLPTLQQLGIGPVVATALATSLGSSRAGAFLLATAHREGRISGDKALWATLSLAFPGYLRRWITTVTVATGLAGATGTLFAVIILFRSLLRFLVALIFMGRTEKEVSEAPVDFKSPVSRLSRHILVTLPWAWTFYALAFLFVPHLERLLANLLGGDFLLPPAGWAVTAAGFGHLSASLAAAGASLSLGDLTRWEALFALLLGNALGLFTRALRQNAAFWFGLFPRELAQRILFCHFATTTPLSLLTLAAAALPLLIGR
jgi:hypothetical protein